jgi:hypothetical protein
MSTSPQAVTERYVTNLINYGRNREFDIDYIKQMPNVVDGENVGVYYVARIGNQIANGATISQAVRRALEKHGVTFR